MSELCVGAEVMGTGGALGVVDALVIDPTTATVTHLVVQHVHLGRYTARTRADPARRDRHMSELRVGAEVMGTGGALGVVDALVIDPTTATVTHLVVQHVHLGRRVLIPTAAVTAATPATVAVALDEAGLAACEQFDEPAFNPAGDYPVTDLGYEPGAYFLEPFASPLDGWALAEHERIPKGEVTFRRGDEVFSSDFERVGHIDEFLVDPADGHVTHVVLREGHVLRHDDDVVVPVAGARFDEGRVIVGLDMAALRDLPRIPVTRHGHIRGESA